MTERTLDWKPNWDDRNMLYAVSEMDCFNGGKALGAVGHPKQLFLDQGAEGACTGFGTAHVIAASPIERPDINDNIARAIYLEAQKQDEWPGEDYSGSSVNGAMKAARLQGYISEWRWCKSLDEIRHALSYHGPLVIGVKWYEGMFSPDENGFIHPTGAVRGGHALMLQGYRGDDFRLENSWGPTWGDNGGCWIAGSALESLIDAQGEFACPVKVPL